MTNQIECPVCGVMIEVDNNSGLKIECPNCHEVVVNKYAREKHENKRNNSRGKISSSKSKRINTQSSSNYTIIGDNDYVNHSTGNDGYAIDVMAVSKFDEDGVKNELINSLVDKDYVPLDIFEELNIESVRKYYIPYQLFEGVYQAPWNAVYQWDEYVDYVENYERKKMRQKQYGESNGIANGKFSYFCLTCEGDNVPPKLLKQAQKRSSILEEVIPYSSEIEIDKNVVVVMPNSNFEKNWKSVVSKEVLAKGKKDAEEQARSNEDGTFLKAIGTGVSLQNFNYQVNYNLTSLQTIMIPFWYVDYSYKNSNYLFIMDGRGKLKELEAPQNKEEKAEVEENEKKKTGCAWYGTVLALWASSIVLGWIYGSWLLFLGLAILGIIVAVVAANKDGKVDDLNEEVRNENKKRRQELAQGLLKDRFDGKRAQLKNNKSDKVNETKTSGNDDYLDSIV